MQLSGTRAFRYNKISKVSPQTWTGSLISRSSHSSTGASAHSWYSTVAHFVEVTGLHDWALLTFKKTMEIMFNVQKGGGMKTHCVSLTSQVILLSICVLFVSTNRMYGMALPSSRQSTFGTVKSTVRSTSLHSCHVTSSQSSLPAQTLKETNHETGHVRNKLSLSPCCRCHQSPIW